ncbi:MAG: hypothetical protein OEY10_03730 [Nitrosopumilus sp.]|nr:hypothetical protein [Nitrosopumilus sp.]
MISIDDILNCMSEEKNYFGDVWEICVDDHKKRYNRAKFRNALQKMEKLGYIKKHGHKNDIYYEKIPFQSFEDTIGFVNNLIFTYESKINNALKKLENRNIFVDISKNLNSFKLNKFTKNDYELLLEGMSGMFELSSSILRIKENSNDGRLKKELANCFTQIKSFLDETNEKLIKFKKTNEIILLQRDFTSKIPKLGYLKL